MYNILVNKNNPLSQDFIPNNLIEIPARTLGEVDLNRRIFIDKVVFEHWNELTCDARKYSYDFAIDSGYRSYDYQAQVYNYNLNKIGDKVINRVAKPGMSEHQTGLAIDYVFFRDGILYEEVSEYHEEYKWIVNNCYKYGFILRYPKEKEHITGYDFEPWHIRYVGVEVATYIYNNNITLEEYKA